MESCTNFLELEKEAMTKLLDGDDEALAILREQYKKAFVRKREFSETVFFTSFDVPEDAPLLEHFKSFQLGDIAGQLDGVKDGVGFVLFVKNGTIQFLEGYTYGDEKWPEKITQFKVTYLSGNKRDMSKVQEKVN